MLPSLGSSWLEPPSKGIMHLYMLLVCALWMSESHSAPMTAVTTTSENNLTALCDEIRQNLVDDTEMYPGSFTRPQNTSEELCYAEFTEIFTCILKNLTEMLIKNKKPDQHINKVYKNMVKLPRICPKLEPTDSPKNCATEESNFSMFKQALESVITSIEGWTSCQKIQGSLGDPVLFQV